LLRKGEVEMRCFADRRKRCAALWRKDCRGCAFWKTRGRLAGERREARRRICALPDSKRQTIFDKYGAAQKGGI